MTGTAIVIGGGIGGLTAAAALSRVGWSVTVLERALSIEPVGSGIGIGPNAVRALDAIDLGNDVRRLASIGGSGGIRRPNGSWLLKTDMTATQERLGDPVVLMHRADLIDLLAAALPAGALNLGRTVQAVEQGGSSDSVEVTVEAAGSEEPPRTLEADLVVAADGIRSQIRGRMFPDHPGPRYAGYTSWRFMVPTFDAPFESAETWGDGARFAALPLSDGPVYCYATENAPAGQRVADELAELRRRFGAWHDPIPALLDAADPATVTRQDMTDFTSPLPAMHAGRVALLGDAAHPMTPNLGQGACQAIEDAVVLAAEVAAGAADVSAALAAYTAARLPRTAAVTKQSHRIGQFGQVSGRVRVRLRDSVLRASGWLPGSTLERSVKPIMGWQPPQLPRA